MESLAGLAAWLTPGPLYNEITSPTLQTGWQILAGPFGLIAFVPLALLARPIAHWTGNKRLSIALLGLTWLVWTLNPTAAALFLACVALGAMWVLLLGALRRRGVLGPRGMIAATWIGLHVLILPFWLHPYPFNYGWEPGPIATLHALGLAYFLFRFIAWGVEWAKSPDQPIRLADSITWMLYPPIMRLGPVMRREEFFDRLERWTPRAMPNWRAVGRRAGWFLLGGVLYAVVQQNTPRVPAGSDDFFAHPEQYSTHVLFALFYLVPIRIYLILWLYNELAAVCGLLVGVPVDNNFDHLPYATSVRDFWRRWHITVGGWLRTYVYIPLGGNRGLRELNYVAVFGYCGIWHGASWSFLAWGLSQGAALSVQLWWDRLRTALGWGTEWRGRAWLVIAWLLTMHYQLATILMFADFDYLGLRVMRELIIRSSAWIGAALF